VSKAVTEFGGTALLLCVVIGSGILGTGLSPDAGVAQLINIFSIIFALALLIFVLGPISGAHFNPAVTLVEVINGNISKGLAALYLAAQFLGAIFGALVANAMFNLAAVQISIHSRVSLGTLIGEVISTAGLIALIGILVHRKQAALMPIAIAAWIGSAAFFTSSTSFANPAVTVGRMFTNTFAGIAPDSVLPFIGAQLVGAFLGVLVSKGINTVR
jgi:glycerol uptake facilitator-like aquaporin